MIIICLLASMTSMIKLFSNLQDLIASVIQITDS